MLVREIFLNEQERYNSVVKHVVQSCQWGDAKEATGSKAYKYGVFDGANMVDGFQLTLHHLPSPLNNWTIGNIAKGTYPTEEMLQSMYVFGQKNNCIFIKVEPNVFGPVTDPNTQTNLKSLREELLETPGVTVKPGKELFTKYNFLLDLTKSNEELMNAMHPKTRYNIGLAQRKNVQIQLRTDEEAFQIYLKLYFETTKRQGYYGHDTQYHRHIWDTLRKSDMARLMIAFYENTPLHAWMLLNFKETLYYPYGGSTNKFRNVMASNLLSWEAIQLGKKMGLQIFDMWGAMGPNPDTTNPWYGFHRFKEGYGPTHIENIGTFDVIVNPSMYNVYLTLDKWRSRYLQIKAKI
ncbi:MAG: peptidoglycan bridge formation glycyltransferase FemA/FemB family protein [bacterium]|nr:peptidoglycan bridge formation glycyltransferase FemA/FemB family protein [bacterium]